MVTFRSPVWNPLIEFLDRLKDYPSFETMNDGKYKKRIQYVLNRALDRMRLDKTDFDLVSETFILLNERDIPQDLIDAMNENVNSLHYKCVTTADGEKIVKEASVIVGKRKRDETARAEADAAQAEFDKAEAARNEYLATHNRIMNEWENAKQKLDAIKATNTDLTDKPVTVEDVKESENKDE